MKATEKDKARMRLYYQSHKDYFKNKASKYFREHEKHLLEERKKWLLKTSHIRHAVSKKHKLFKAELLDSIKYSNPCLDCGIYYEPCQMDFDHIHNKRFGIGAYLTSKEEVLFKEIAKCQLVCSNCHRLRTKERKDACLSSYR